MSIPTCRVCPACGIPVDSESGVCPRCDRPVASVVIDVVLRIGRAPDNDLVLGDPCVSAHHAQLYRWGDEIWIKDLGSTNGTAIGSPEHKVVRSVVTAETDVYFGSLRVPAARLLAASPTLGGHAANAAPMSGRATVFGRDPSCDQVLDDPLISRCHARLTRSDGSLSIEDLNSTNGTYVNGKRIRGPVPVRPGDLIGLGRFMIRVGEDGRLEQRDCRGNVSIEVRELSLRVGDRQLLDNVSLTIYPSEFVGLMGPSGAGKTTLMNALNGYTPPTTGAVRFNGDDLYANYGQFQGVIGYVPQDDIMHGELTVAQALYYTARLRLPADSTDAEIATRVRAVVEQLGLQGTEHVLIGSPQKKGISGGQRKRVNLAMELLTDPAVLFLDEPTSGLSSEDALNVMRLLRRLADQGKTIVLTIHQPSLEAYRLLDNLILVAKDRGSRDPGRLVYYGPAYPQAVQFFNPDQPQASTASPPSPDDVLRGLAQEKCATWGQRYATSSWKRQFVEERAGQPLTATAATPAVRRQRELGFQQWWTLVRRACSVKVRDRMNTAILTAQAPIIAGLIALVFGSEAAKEATTETWPAVANATATAVFLMALAALWFGCSNSAREIVAEWAIYHRERMVNLKIPSFVGAKFAVLGALCCVQCGVLLAIVYAGAGLRGPWLDLFLVLVLTSFVGLAIGLTISTVARTSEVAIALLPLILLPMVMLAGVMQPLHKMNRIAAGLAQVMPSRWAFESLLLLEAEKRPSWTPPVMPVPSPPSTAPDSETNHAASPKQDMAEPFFPEAEHRTGIRPGVIVLAAMLLGMAALIHGLLRARDAH